MAKGRWRGVGGRPQLLAVGVYFVVTAAYLLIAPLSHFREHTTFNHFALLAQAWLEHRLDLGQVPPFYTGRNDFALFDGRWYVVFPPVPALLITPLVLISGGANQTHDGAFFTLLAGLGPAGMFLTIERARREGWSKLTRLGALGLTAIFAFGTVYFFTAVQGTVWYAAHVVGAAGTTFFLYYAIGARNPLRAGFALAIAVGTRPVLCALGLFFLTEWSRIRRGDTPSGTNAAAVNRGRRPAPDTGWRTLVIFALPVALCLVALAWLNLARFGNPFEFGYRYLAIAWQSRIEKWGLFGYHYLARNLALLLTSLPYLDHGRDGWTVQVNGHGLALWITTPLYWCLLWPRQRTPIHAGLYLTLLLVMVPSLLYQNSGWVQFGQRFSNDYAPLLILLLAIGGYTWNWLKKALGVAAVGVNLFGALTFGRPEAVRFYFIEPTQRIIFQPD